MIGNAGNANTSKQTPRYAKSTAANFISVIGDNITLKIEHSYSIVNESSADYVSGFLGTGYISSEKPESTIRLLQTNINHSYAHWNKINSTDSKGGIIANITMCYFNKSQPEKVYYRKFNDITINPFGCLYSSGSSDNSDTNYTYFMSNQIIPYAYLPLQHNQSDRSMGISIPKFEIPRTPSGPSLDPNKSTRLFSELSSSYWKESICKVGGKDYKLAVLKDNIVEGCN